MIPMNDPTEEIRALIASVSRDGKISVQVKNVDPKQMTMIANKILHSVYHTLTLRGFADIAVLIKSVIEPLEMIIELSAKQQPKESSNDTSGPDGDNGNPAVPHNNG